MCKVFNPCISNVVKLRHTDVEFCKKFDLPATWVDFLFSKNASCTLFTRFSKIFELVFLHFKSSRTETCSKVLGLGLEVRVKVRVWINT